MQRIDHPGPTQRGLLFHGATLDREPDDELQAIVEADSEACDTPVALVSLVLDRIQFFRAHRGLPPDLALACATDRDASFCQLVVQTGEPFETSNAPLEKRLPQALVDRYGLRAYLGLPLRLDGNVVGTLCVLDTVVRPFTGAQREALSMLAVRAERRLRAMENKPTTSLKLATQPAFAELRNALSPLYADVMLARTALAELTPLAQILGQLNERPELMQTLSVLSRAAEATSDLRHIVTSMTTGLDQVQTTLQALEAATTADAPVTMVSDLTQQADLLASHITRLVGGVWWPPVSASLAIRADRQKATVDLAAAAVVLATQLYETGFSEGIAVTIEDHTHQVVITLRGGTTPSRALREQLSGLLQAGQATHITVNTGAIRLIYPVV